MPNQANLRKLFEEGYLKEFNYASWVGKTLFVRDLERDMYLNMGVQNAWLGFRIAAKQFEVKL